MRFRLNTLTACLCTWAWVAPYATTSPSIVMIPESHRGSIRKALALMMCILWCLIQFPEPLSNMIDSKSQRVASSRKYSMVISPEPRCTSGWPTKSAVIFGAISGQTKVKTPSIVFQVPGRGLFGVGGRIVEKRWEDKALSLGSAYFLVSTGGPCSTAVYDKRQTSNAEGHRTPQHSLCCYHITQHISNPLRCQYSKYSGCVSRISLMGVM